MDWWRIVCCAAAGYLLGSCNGAIVVSHTCMHDDIRKKRQRKRRPDEFSAELRRLGNAARRPDGYG